jgi:hypothetical protein
MPEDRDPTDALTGNAEYDALPRAIREQHPLEGWLWLSEQQKGRLTQTETEPEF